MSDLDLKNKKNFLVVVDITEKENTVLDDFGNIKDINGNAILTIKNPSERSRLWNIICDTKETVNTSLLAREIKVDTIGPLKDFSTEFTISNLKEPLLKITEKFDTFVDFSDRVNNVFLFAQDNKCQLKILLTNPIDVDILNIKVVKEIPPIFKEIQIITPSNGTASKKEEEGTEKIFWEINSLKVGQTAELKVNCLGVINSVELQSLGELKATYLVNDKILTLIDPEIFALTESMSGVTRNEGSQPGVWDCNVEFINESEFQVKLNEVRVEHKIVTGKEVVASLTPEKVLNRDQSWDYNFNIESKEVPQLEPTFEFTALYTVIKHVEGMIIKEPLYYPVLRAEVEKDIKPPEVGAYANTEMEIVNTILNKGSASIDKLIISDIIVDDFEPPDLKQIKIFAKSGEEIKTLETGEYITEIKLTPDDKDLTKSHRIEIDINNMSNNLSPDSSLIISYPIIARNPKPDKKYEIPISIQINTQTEGKTYIISPSETPEIKIKYIARKFKTLKSIKPGDTEGEFIINIRLQNKGDVELENIVLKDKIPATFELTSFSPMDLKYEIIKGETESDLVANIAEIEAATTLKIEYKCFGTGEYPRSEPIVVVEGRKDVVSETKEKMDTVVSSTDESDISYFVKNLSSSVKSQILAEIKNLQNTITPGLKSAEIGSLIEKTRDIIAEIARVGPFLHQIGKIAREFKDLGEEIVVGELHDKLTQNFKDWREKLS